MTRELVLTAAGFVLLFVVIMIYERIRFRRSGWDDLPKRVERDLEPWARKADALHQQKFGRPSSEIGKAFPRLRQVK